MSANDVYYIKETSKGRYSISHEDAEDEGERDAFAQNLSLDEALDLAEEDAAEYGYEIIRLKTTQPSDPGQGVTELQRCKYLIGSTLYRCAKQNNDHEEHSIWGYEWVEVEIIALEKLQQRIRDLEAALRGLLPADAVLNTKTAANWWSGRTIGDWRKTRALLTSTSVGDKR